MRQGATRGARSAGPSVLVTDGLWRKSLSAVRSLGRAGLTVGVAGDSRVTTAFFSRHCARRVLLPPAGDGAPFRSALLHELDTHRYEVLFPMEDETIAALLPWRREVERRTHLPLPASERYAVASDKAATAELAARLGIAVPRGLAVGSPAQLEDAAGQLAFP